MIHFLSHAGHVTSFFHESFFSYCDHSILTRYIYFNFRVQHGENVPSRVSHTIPCEKHLIKCKIIKSDFPVRVALANINILA